MDADQTMRQRALELAFEVAKDVGDHADTLQMANEYYQFMKSGTLPAPPAEDE